jgi:hypothetical protein
MVNAFMNFVGVNATSCMTSEWICHRVWIESNIISTNQLECHNNPKDGTRLLVGTCLLYGCGLETNKQLQDKCDNGDHELHNHAKHHSLVKVANFVGVFNVLRLL